MPLKVCVLQLWLIIHYTDGTHDVGWSNVKILACDYNEHNLFYLESLIISKHKPTLNKMQTSVNINLFT